MIVYVIEQKYLSSMATNSKGRFSEDEAYSVLDVDPFLKWHMAGHLSS